MVLCALHWDGRVSLAVAALPVAGTAAWVLLSFCTSAVANGAARTRCLPLAAAPMRGSMEHMLRLRSRREVRHRTGPAASCAQASPPPLSPNGVCVCSQYNMSWVWPVTWVMLGVATVLLLGLRAVAWDPLADAAWAWCLLPLGALVLCLGCRACGPGRGSKAAQTLLVAVAPFATTGLLAALSIGGQIHINVRAGCTGCTVAHCTRRAVRHASH